MKKFIITTAIIGLNSPIIVWASDAGISDVHIRSLAASCAACHGTQGNAVRNSAEVRTEVSTEQIPPLAGTNKTDIIAKLQAFKSGGRTATVMHRHAKGLSPQEITALAEYFSAQTPHISTPLTPQKLRADHAN